MKHPMYDAEVHVTAKQLRIAGFSISDDIPDEAFVGRYSLRFGGVKAVNAGDGFYEVTMDVAITEPFKWLELKP